MKMLRLLLLLFVSMIFSMSSYANLHSIVDLAKQSQFLPGETVSFEVSITSANINIPVNFDSSNYILSNSAQNDYSVINKLLTNYNYTFNNIITSPKMSRLISNLKFTYVFYRNSSHNFKNINKLL